MKTRFSRFKLCFWCELAALLLAIPHARATLTAGTNSFTRPLDHGAAISLQAITTGDSDSAQIPFFVSQVDAASAQGGVIVRTNDWLYYTPPGGAAPAGSDLFAYVITNLVGDIATGAVSIASSANFVPTNLLTVSLVTNQPSLQFFGNVGPYFVQTSTNLQTWLNAGARLAWPTGYFSFSNPATPPGQTLFFRAATGASAPLITNYLASGTANVQVDFALGIEGGPGSPFWATILTLPSQGALFQDDGTAITQVPARVTSAHGILHYFGPINGYGTDFAPFQYKITRQADGLDSLPATFRFSLGLDYPTVSPATFPAAPEWGGGTNLPLIATDPDLIYPSNHIQFFVIFPPTRGTLYQVNPDGTPNLGEPITNDDTVVENSSNWVYYLPPGGQYGTPYESFTVEAVNSFGVSSAPASLPVSIYFVDSPPLALPGVVTGMSDDLYLGGQLPFSDFDRNLATIRFPSLPARGQLYYSNQQLPPASTNLVSPANYIFACDPSGGGFVTFVTDSHTNGVPCIPDFNDYGANYASFTYIVTDVDGESATNSVIVNVSQGPPFSVPSGPTNYTGSVDFPISFQLSATNQDGSLPDPGNVIVLLDSLPAHGQLSVQGFPITSVAATGLTLATPFVYTPDSGYYSPAGNPDGFSYRLNNGHDAMQCSASVTLTVLQIQTTPPPSGPPP
jgi:hypothetical protein